MCSPVAHGVVGLAIAQFVQVETLRGRIAVWLFLATSAVAADFDFLPGLLTGDFNYWHRGPTHSLFAAVIWGVVTFFILRAFTPRARAIALLGAIAYASHIGLDLLGSDTRAPFGIPVWWPFSDTYSMIEPSVFGGFKHGVPGDDLTTVLKAVFSQHNLGVIWREVIFAVPVFLVALIAGKLFRRRAD